MSVGASLREIRERAALTIPELASRTRIPESVIAELEQDNFSASIGAPYVRGHIKTIARICNSDAEPILTKFESQTIPLNKSIRDLLNDMNATPAQKPRRQISWRSLAGVTVGILAFAIVGAVIFASTKSGSETVLTKESSTKVETGPVAKKSEKVEITLKGVDGLSWVAVNDSAGVTRFSGRIRQGEERSFADDQLLYLVIGNAGAVQLIVNGEDLGVAGAVGEVVRLEFGPQALSSQG